MKESRYSLEVLVVVQAPGTPRLIVSMPWLEDEVNEEALARVSELLRTRLGHIFEDLDSGGEIAQKLEEYGCTPLRSEILATRVRDMVTRLPVVSWSIPGYEELTTTHYDN